VRYLNKYRGRKKLRPPLRWFADWMETNLQKNDHKSGWQSMTLGELVKRLADEKGELSRRIARVRRCGEAAKEGLLVEVILEAADVANFAMFIADVARAELEAKRRT